MPKRKSVTNKTIAVILGLVLVGVAGFGLYAYFTGLNPFSATPTSGNSSFQLISYVDGEDVSDFVEISIWIPDSNAEFDETEDIYTWSNFEEEESSKDADDVSIDLSGVKYAWLEIDPDGEQPFSNTHHLLIGGANYKYIFYVYDLSTDVNFGFANESLCGMWTNFTVPDGDTDGNVPTGWSGATALIMANEGGLVDENITLILNVPSFTPNGTHVGTNWNVEQSEYDDMSVAEVEFMHDEANYQCQAPIYIPANDLEKSGEDKLEALTEAFAIRFTYNTTVSTTDAATTQINCTITDDSPVEVIIDGTYIYFVFYEPIKFDDGPVVVEFEYQEEALIYATAIESGRLLLPRDEDTIGAFTVYGPVGM